MICDFCRREIADVDIIEARNIGLIPAWCNHCGAFSNGKERMRLPHLGICLSMDRTFEEARKKMEGPLLCNKPKGHEGPHQCLVGEHLLGWWIGDASPAPDKANVYYETAKNAQEAGTKLWNTVVRVRNLLRVAQPYLESRAFVAGGANDPEIDALCAVIAKEIGTLEDNTTEEDGRKVAERLGIDIEKWAAELRAKVDAAEAKEKEER